MAKQKRDKLNIDALKRPIDKKLRNQIRTCLDKQLICSLYHKCLCI